MTIMSWMKGEKKVNIYIFLCILNKFALMQVRRGKINERLKCLQDIVPGCRKVKFLSAE